MSASATLNDAARGIPGRPVLLDGRASTGATTYLWELLEPHDPAVLSNADQPVAALTSDHPGEFVVRLTVLDAQGGAPSAALCVVELKPWVAIVDAPGSAQVREAVVCDASRSQAPADATYTWDVVVQGSGRPPLSAADGPRLRIYPMGPGAHDVTLKVFSPGRSEPVASADVSIDVSEPDPDAQSSADEEYWQEQMLADIRAAPAALRTAASTWQGYTTTLIGLFSTVALVAGPKTITDVKYPLVGWFALACVGLAFLAAFAGLYLLAKVTASGPVPTGGTKKGVEYQAATLQALNTDRSTFAWSKRCTIGAAVLIAVGSLAVAAAAFVPPESGVTVLVRTPTSTICGELTTDDHGAMTVAGTAISGRTEAVTVVDSCGSETATP